MKLELRNITKSFSNKQALKDISLTAKSGRAFGLLGRNGAGKTTTIRILMNVFKANSGEILLDDNPLDYSNISFGYLPEERGLYPKEKVLDQLIYLAKLKGMKRQEAVQSVDYWLDFLKMTEYRNKKLETLSKGNQQKIQLISSVAHNPDIIVFDEPFSGLDPVNARLLEEVVKEQIRHDKLVIFSSHQMSYIEEFCDDILILKDGEVMLSGNIKKIKQSYSRNQLIINTNEAKSLLKQYPENSELFDKNTILFRLASPNDKQKTMKKLVNTFDIDSIGILEPTLNDIFVDYAGDDSK